VRPPLRWIATALLLFAMAWLACGGETARRSHRNTPAKSVGGLSAEAFFRDPLLSHAALSPDGKRIAAVTARDGVAVLIVRPTWGGEIQQLAKLDEPGMALRTVGWAGDETILVGVDMPYKAAIGERARQSRLMAVPLDGRKPRYLGEDWPYQAFSQYQDQIIDWLPEDGKHVLINYWAPGKQGASVARVNVANGALNVVVNEKPWVINWFADHEGRVRAGEGGRRTGTSWIVYGRANEEDSFETLADYDRFSGVGFTFAGYDPDPNKLYVYAPTAHERIGLFSYDLARHELSPVIYEDPNFDVGALVQSRLTGRLLGVEVVGDRPSIHYFDAAAAREQAAIDRAFPGVTTRIVSQDRAEKIAIVEVSGDTRPPEYYVYDRGQKRMDFLFAAYPALDAKSLAPMKAVRYPARDGLEIQAYLTLPRGGETHLPTIVLPHGGPTARDVWGWDAEAQFLASRGFAVFQPNFRGSTGFGRAHERNGYRQWGLAMQDDLSDGVAWLVAQGIADPDRVGIYGASYGGYAALEGLVKTPELYRAGASFAGVSDMIEWLDDADKYRFSDFNKPVHGDASDDRDQLASTSPARHADRVRAPVLIAHGEEDPVVGVEQSRKMADALEAAGVAVETHYYPNEVHGFIDERDRIDFHEKLADFFARNLAPRAAR
jgi:dipeptidyl aminopeptidase/acylaminoacyl peptidase